MKPWTPSEKIEIALRYWNVSIKVNTTYKTPRLSWFEGCRMLVVNLFVKQPSLHFSWILIILPVASQGAPMINELKGRIPLNAGDVLTVVAFNQIRPHNYTRRSGGFLSATPFDRSYSGNQHSVFRFALSYDEPAYAPPAFFKYALLNQDFFDIRIETNFPWMSIFTLDVPTPSNSV